MKFGGVGFRRVSLLHCPEAAVGERLQHTVLYPDFALDGLAHVIERRSLRVLFGGIADNGYALVEQPFADPVAAAAFGEERAAFVGLARIETPGMRDSSMPTAAGSSMTSYFPGVERGLAAPVAAFP